MFYKFEDYVQQPTYKNKLEIFSDGNNDYITVLPEYYNRDCLCYGQKIKSKNGKKIRGTYFETGAKRLIDSLKLRKPLLNKKIRIIPTKQQNWIEYILEELEN